MRVIAHIRSLLRVDLPLRSLFESATVAELAKTAITYEKKPGQVEKIAQFLQTLDLSSTKGEKEENTSLSHR
jgi:hypothetical protein